LLISNIPRIIDKKYHFLLKKPTSPMKRVCTHLLHLLLAAPTVLTANGFRLVSQDAFAAARGEAFVATADNPSAIHYNPAGISQLDGFQFRLGAYALHFEPTFTPPSTSTDPFATQKTHDIEENDALAPQLYCTYRLPESPLTLGLGIYAPHGASVTWPQDTGFRTVALDGELTYLRINPVASLEIRPGLSFAVGAMIDDASTSNGQGLLVTENPFKNSFDFEGDALSVGYNLGILWQINEQWSVGATYRSKSLMNFEGETTVEQDPFFSKTTVDADMELEFPDTAVFGVSYRPTERWNIEFNADYSNWSSIDTTTIKQKDPPPYPVQQDIPVTMEWKDSWMLKFGVTHYFDEGWHASAGYLFNENSVPSTNYSPVVADLDRHFFSLGVGRQWSRYHMDLAYQYGFSPERTVRGSKPPSTPAANAGQNANGTYDFASHALLISFGMEF
jgi:long-chain fatty acid transport protein